MRDRSVAKWRLLLIAAARRWILVMLLVSAGLAGCSPDSEPRPRAIDGVFPPTGELPQLPFRVSDQTGLIRAIAVVKASDVPEGVSQVTGRDDALYLEWRGGLRRLPAHGPIPEPGDRVHAADRCLDRVSRPTE